eukprot:GHVR01141184.1.p1 GENE.GHVR01141184.1~~GHVR01141184.1.p1  ORF type:complete len:137 (+),score=16.75 GHVR01141184.1:425-835(+)
MDIIEIFKSTMKQTGATAESVANLSNISKYSVDNILQKRSNRYDYIVKIARALDIPIFDSIIPNKNKVILIETDNYSKTLKILSNILDKRKKNIIPKNCLQDCLYNLYLYIQKNPDNYELQSAYAEGLIDNFIKKI